MNDNHEFQPYQLVIVSSEHGQYVGESMSYGTTEDTLMVRRVPGHPGTLNELPLAQLRRISERDSKKFRWVHYATVKGVGQFPVDMLRYDWAAPVNFALLDGRHGWGTVAEIDPTHGLEGYWIARFSDRRDPQWTSARWSSFLWGVKHQKTEHYIPGG